jgi:hypothetical protein
MSKLEVNTVEPQCGTTLTVGESGGSVRTGSNNLQASDGGNLISQSGTTITLGASGDTVTLASGASQSGFGRTGTVDWDTTPKTATFSAVSGDGFFCNTTSGAFTCNLPAGSAGAIVSVADYAGTWQNNALTVVPNGSDKIGGFNANVILSTEGQSVTFVFVDSTQGWVNTMDSTSNERGTAFVTATGGNAVLTNGNFKTHIFTGPGTFCVSCAGNPGGSNTVDYFVVAGGGGAGQSISGGGGAGGFRQSNSVGCISAPNMSPLANPTGLSVSVQGYPIAVGGGGAGGPSSAQGITSTFSTISSAGGGDSNGYNGTGNAGGSGGGGSAGCSGTRAAGAGNTPPVSPPQGNNGGPSTHTNTGGGGGGASAVGGTGAGSAAPGGAGSFIGTPFIGPTAPSYGATGPAGRYFSGAGGGGIRTPGASPNSATAGLGGGGYSRSGNTGTDGTPNTGGGGGGGNYDGTERNGGSGGSGIVMIRYKFQ